MITAQAAAQDAELTNNQWESALRAVQENGFLSDVPAGVLRQIIGQGIESLSEAQQYVYRSEIAPALTEKCLTANCSNRVICGVECCEPCKVEGMDR